uniref:FYVE-type domain-containing protein n=1 Tax=Strigamia maritima TaxID=126957 RepID=T1J9N5_STRMM
MSCKLRAPPTGAKSKKLHKTRSSLRYCQERLACRGPQPIAHYRCHECESFQCEACESVLHETAKYLFHDRIRLETPASELLCDAECSERNFADVNCENCNRNLCHHCDGVIHAQKKKKSHTRVPYRVDKEGMIEMDDAFSSLPDVGEDGGAGFVGVDGGAGFVGVMAQLGVSSAAIIDSSPFGREENVGLVAESKVKSFLLVDNEEVMQIDNEEDFIKHFGAGENASVKVVSIFGNTGEGKSHTLNHTFFDGEEAFHTSPSTTSDTIGVWAAFDSTRKIVVIDTEGLLGISTNQNKRTRLLLKVIKLFNILAISDVVIYRTRAGRLHSDLFQFLGDASAAYLRHFVQELRLASERCNLDGPLSSLGPVVIIFHETQHTEYLKKTGSKTAEDQLKQRFRELNYSVDAFSAIEYIGIQTSKPPTTFDKLQAAISKHLDNSTVRSPRQLSIIFHTLKILNEKFTGDIETTIPHMFPDQYFTCSCVCLSCGSRCSNSMNHNRDGIPHTSSEKCKYEYQYENKIYTCKKCYEEGREMIVVPKTSASTESTWYGLAKYAWSGYVLECIRCGIIYRSRQFWYGNRDPVETGNLVLQGTHNAARKVLDGVSYLSSTVSSVSAKPTKMLTSWVTDQVAPAYWVPNSQITHCHKCHKEFEETESKHHCRACGQGFCEDCSSKLKLVPERGWGNTPVRVCDDCYVSTVDEMSNPSPCLDSAGSPSPTEGQELIARKVTEVIQNTLGKYIKDSARPAYWVPDHEITHCNNCKVEFSIKISKHHCRACGEGVCGNCSNTTRSVPSRGWDTPVRCN